MENEKAIISVVMYAGNAHSLAMEAVSLAKSGSMDEAQRSLDEAGTALLEAHRLHAELLSLDARDELEVRLLLVHAEDQLMAASLAIDFSKELVELHRLLLERD